MADVSIQTKQAQDWVARVKGEIERTNSTLKEVRDVCTSAPGEDDSIIKIITETGNMLENTWDATTNAFKNAWDILEDGIKVFSQVGEKIAEGFDNLKNVIK